MELVPFHDTGQEFRTIQYWPARVIAPIKRPRHHRRWPDVKPRPLLLCMHSALSGVFLVLPRWSKDVSMHLISGNSINLNRVFTHGFLHPQRLDGDVLKTTTTTSQHDGAKCTCIHTMNDPTPII